jgi:integrase
VRGTVDAPRAAGPRDGRHAHRLRTSPRRALGPLRRVNPEEHWVIADLVGKGGHVRTVPIPTWVKAAVDAWTAAAAITNGSVFRAINKAGRVWGDGMSPKVLWDVVRAAAARAGIDKLAPHDLRRTCARLEFHILSLNPGWNNIAWRLMSDLRCLAHERASDHFAGLGRRDREAMWPRRRASGHR